MAWDTKSFADTDNPNAKGIHRWAPASLPEGQKFRPADGKLTMEQWAANKGTPHHEIAAVASYLGADEHLQVSEADFDGALEQWRGASFGHHAVTPPPPPPGAPMRPAKMHPAPKLAPVQTSGQEAAAPQDLQAEPKE